MSLSSMMGGVRLPISKKTKRVQTDDAQPPYPLNNAQIGGIPSVTVDIPPLAVFLSLHATAAAISMLLAESHRRKGHGRTIPIITFLFSGERVLACAMRMAWASRPGNVRVAVASQVLLQAGVLLLLLLNLILAERVLLGQRPGRSAGRCLRALLGAMSALTVSALIMVVVSIIVSVYSLDQRTIEQCRDVQRAAASYLVVLAVAPVALLLVAALLSNEPIPRATKVRSKVAIVLSSCLLCTLNAGFKAGVVWARPKSLFDPAWYHSRACLYTFVLGTEVVVLVLVLATRADLKFIPAASLRNEFEREGGVKAVECEKGDSGHAAGMCTRVDVEPDGLNYSSLT